MKKKQFNISHPLQLNTLSTLPLYRKAGLGTLVLADTFQHAEKDRLQKELNKHYHACGCDTGARAFLWGIVIFGAAAVYLYRQNSWTFLMSLGLCAGGAILLSGFGKFYGKVKANTKLKETVSRIKKEWNATPVKGATQLACG